MDLDDKAALSEWRSEWATDFALLAKELRAALGGLALRIDHIGSTSIPGLCAKDVIDMQVIVDDLDPEAIVGAMETIGFGHRDQGWNLGDHIPAGWTGNPNQWAKLVFGPPPGVRMCNVHVRVAGAPNERYALLFRDFLRDDASARIAWGRFKEQLAFATPTLRDYGAVKDPATDVLMSAAERWAMESDWAGP
jgi:dephospho-CoA kinase